MLDSEPQAWISFWTSPSFELKTWRLRLNFSSFRAACPSLRQRCLHENFWPGCSVSCRWWTQVARGATDKCYPWVTGGCYLLCSSESKPAETFIYITKWFVRLISHNFEIISQTQLRLAQKRTEDRGQNMSLLDVRPPWWPSLRVRSEKQEQYTR